MNAKMEQNLPTIPEKAMANQPIGDVSKSVAISEGALTFAYSLYKYLELSGVCSYLATIKMLAKFKVQYSDK